MLRGDCQSTAVPQIKCKVLRILTRSERSPGCRGRHWGRVRTVSRPLVPEFRPFIKVSTVPSLLRTPLTRTTKWTWRVLILVTVFFNARLYWPSPLAATSDTVPPDLVEQLAANRSALDAGSPTQMQKYFPEGFYFSYLFHGLTWVELAMRDGSYSKKAIAEAVDCLAQLESDEGRAVFPPQLPPGHGMFYSAWKCHLRAGVVVLQEGADGEQLAIFRKECDAIAAALKESRTPFLASYQGSAWPCDTVPAIHALSVYDRVTNGDRYNVTIDTWLKDAFERVDLTSDLLPHTASLPDGRNVGVARATSQVIMLRYLPDIDPSLARDQYTKFRERFLTTFVGAPCVLEYPSGISGPGDVDSGPLIFGRSLVGTVMMMAIAQIYGDHDVADAIAQAGETVGLPWTSGGKKKYVVGAMPIGDIIVAYSHVARPWFAEKQHHPEVSHKLSPLWRWQIHAWSCLVFLPWIISFYRQRVRRSTKTVDGQNEAN